MTNAEDGACFDLGEGMVNSTLLGCIGAAALTIFAYWLPRSERWIRSREQRRTMVPYTISTERFEQLERISATVFPLMGLLLTVALAIRLAIGEG
jgi:hypothetical protein